MVNVSKLCDDKCLNPIPRGQRRVVPVPESPFVDYAAPDPPTTTTSTTTTTAYPLSLNQYIRNPDEDVECPIVYPEVLPTTPPSLFSVQGGTINEYEYNGVKYKSHVFLDDGELNVEVLDDNSGSILTLDVLLVGGGGGGGFSSNGYGGGGGGGGFLLTTTKVRVGNYTVEIGRGGNGNQNGSATKFNQLIAYGGGAGGPPFQNGINGASGGGGGLGTVTSGGTGISGQGFAGSSVTVTSFLSSGGGGGAGEKALDITELYTAGNGGGGRRNNYIDGINRYYSGGGGGVRSFSPGLGGAGGGGSQRSGFDKDGSQNTGGGGAGGIGNTVGSGGDGILIIRYRI